MNNINIATNLRAIPNWEKFDLSCRDAWELVTDSAPSDSFVSISVQQEQDRFFVKFSLASKEFKFSVESKAVSPYAALECGLRDSLNRVKKWSLTRELQPS